jgi:hypothetical protein
MSFRSRLAVAGLVLSAALAVALAGIVSSDASIRAGTISAHLTSSSFPAAKAAKVKLFYKFSSHSKHFGYVLSQKKGAKWLSVRSVHKRGSFKGSHSTSVKSLFGAKAVRVGRYRLRLSADGNTVTRAFRVVRAGSGSSGSTAFTPPPGAFGKIGPAHGLTEQAQDISLSWGGSSGATGYDYCIDKTYNTSCDSSWISVGVRTNASVSGLSIGTTYWWQVRATNKTQLTEADDGSWFSFTVVRPRAGHWISTVSSLVEFYVVPDQTRTLRFTFWVSGTAGSCNVSGPIMAYTNAIEGGSFSGSVPTLSGAGTFSGTFDSPTSAHGWVRDSEVIGVPCNGSFDSGQVSWTATWQDATQPGP